MWLLSDIVASLRRAGRGRLARHDLRQLSAAQLADIGIEPDHLGEVIDGLLARPEPFDPSPRIKPEFEWRGLNAWWRHEATANPR